MLWDGKRYNSLSYYLKHKYGEKVYKLSLDGGMTCPNRDGKIDTRGCIFCSIGGSGDFAEPTSTSITNQIEHAIARAKVSKPFINKYIAYFQSYTNTYAPIDYLKKIFNEAITHPDICGLSVATRPDCLPDEIISLLSDLNHIKPVWVELGLQTIHESTAKFIRRGYSLSTFDNAVSRLSNHSLDIIIHMIIGLPWESEADILETVDYLSRLPIQGIKLQLLHVLKDTDLADYIGRFHILTMDEYISIIIKCLERLPEDVVIHRLTGDGPANLLIEPSWSTNKRLVLGSIDKALKEADTWQGRLFSQNL